MHQRDDVYIMQGLVLPADVLNTATVLWDSTFAGPFLFEGILMVCTIPQALLSLNVEVEIHGDVIGWPAIVNHRLVVGSLDEFLPINRQVHRNGRVRILTSQYTKPDQTGLDLISTIVKGFYN